MPIELESRLIVPGRRRIGAMLGKEDGLAGGRGAHQLNFIGGAGYRYGSVSGTYDEEPRSSTERVWSSTNSVEVHCHTLPTASSIPKGDALPAALNASTAAGPDHETFLAPLGCCGAPPVGMLRVTWA